MSTRAPELAPWADHCSVVTGASKGGLLSGSPLPMFPSLARRLQALGRMGANVRATPRSWSPTMVSIDAPLIAIVVPLMLVVVVVVLLCYLSALLSMLFTWIPARLRSALLRWLAS